MLYRECRFQAAYQIFNKVVPDTPEYKVFQILGGMEISICKLKVQKSQFYFLSGGCTALSFEVFFNLFDIKYEMVDIEHVIKDTSICDSSIYVIPLSRSIIKKETNELSELEISMLGHSYAIIKEVEEGNDRIILNNINPLSQYDIQESNDEWVSINVFQTISQTVNSPFYDLSIHSIDIDALKNNETIKNLCNMETSSIVYSNLKKVLSNDVSPIDPLSIRGQQVYDILCRHLVGLNNLLKTDPNENIRKYVRIQVMYLRFSIASGSDSFYREEFVDSLKYLFEGKVNVEVEILMTEWKNMAYMWRRIGRTLGKLHIQFTEDLFEKLVLSFLNIKDTEPILIEKTKKLLNKKQKVEDLSDQLFISEVI